MMKTLRRKFIFFAMTAVTVLLLALLIAINVLTWTAFDQQSDETLNKLADSNGLVFKLPAPPRKPGPFLLPDIDALRAARFFVVIVDTADEILSCDTDQVLFISDDEAAEFARTALSRSLSSGRIDQYKYRINQTEDTKTLIFLDVSREQFTMKVFMVISIIIALGSWLVSLLFVVLTSSRFVQPIIAGMEKQKQFITNAGHELKTPLAIIQSNNDAMTLIHGENKYNRNIKEQVVRLGELTSNLLMQARLDEEVELLKEQTNISELIKDVLRTYKDSVEAHGMTLISHISEGIQMNTNRQAFTQLVNVLMDNAVKYTSDNGEILFSLSQDGHNIILTEENSCETEMNDDPERLFERFYRGDDARTQSDHRSGYGIGLSVARSICESLGGSLKADYPQSGRIRFTAKF